MLEWALHGHIPGGTCPKEKKLRGKPQTELTHWIIGTFRDLARFSTHRFWCLGCQAKIKNWNPDVYDNPMIAASRLLACRDHFPPPGTARCRFQRGDPGEMGAEASLSARWAASRVGLAPGPWEGTHQGTSQLFPAHHQSLCRWAWTRDLDQQPRAMETSSQRGIKRERLLFLMSAINQ